MYALIRWRCLPICISPSLRECLLVSKRGRLNNVICARGHDCDVIPVNPEVRAGGCARDFTQSVRSDHHIRLVSLHTVLFPATFERAS